MLVEYLQKNKFFRKIIYKAGDKRAKSMVKKIESFLKKGDNILDIGSGTCNICETLHTKGHKVIPLDIQNLSFVDSIKPILYDGTKIPFEDNKFDVALLLTVLHHTPDPKKILNEAKRVSKRIVVIEDVYTNEFHKCLTYFFDSLLNLEFIGHPHTNKTEKEWKKIFQKLGLNLIDVKYNNFLLVIKHGIYYLDHKS